MIMVKMLASFRSRSFRTGSSIALLLAAATVTHASVERPYEWQNKPSPKLQLKLMNSLDDEHDYLRVRCYYLVDGDGFGGFGVYMVKKEEQWCLLNLSPSARRCLSRTCIPKCTEVPGLLCTGIEVVDSGKRLEYDADDIFKKVETELKKKDTAGIDYLFRKPKLPAASDKPRFEISTGNEKKDRYLRIRVNHTNHRDRLGLEIMLHEGKFYLEYIAPHALQLLAGTGIEDLCIFAPGAQLVALQTDRDAKLFWFSGKETDECVKEFRDARQKLSKRELEYVDYVFVKPHWMDNEDKAPIEQGIRTTFENESKRFRVWFKHPGPGLDFGMGFSQIGRDMILTRIDNDYWGFLANTSIRMGLTLKGIQRQKRGEEAGYYINFGLLGWESSVPGGRFYTGDTPTSKYNEEMQLIHEWVPQKHEWTSVCYEFSVEPRYEIKEGSFVYFLEALHNYQVKDPRQLALGKIVEITPNHYKIKVCKFNENTSHANDIIETKIKKIIQSVDRHNLIPIQLWHDMDVPWYQETLDYLTEKLNSKRVEKRLANFELSSIHGTTTRFDDETASHDDFDRRNNL